MLCAGLDRLNLKGENSKNDLFIPVLIVDESWVIENPVVFLISLSSSADIFL